MPVASDRASAKSRTVPSSATDVARGRLGPARCTNVRTAQAAKARADEAGPGSQRHPLDRELTGQVPLIGAERRPERQLPPSGETRGEEQIGDIRTRDQEQESDGAHHDPERLDDGPDDGLIVGFDVDAVVVMKLDRKRLPERDHLALGQGWRCHPESLRRA